VLKDCSVDYIEKKLKNYERNTLAATPRVAAVLIPIINHGQECNILFTKRLRHLTHHGGEVSFPGGIMDPDDKSLYETALRETHEEIGVESSGVQILGAMDDELSKWGHRVTPYTGVLKSTDFTLQQSEVDRVYMIPVSHLMNPSNYYSENWIHVNQSREVHFYRYGDDIIWGLTARILYNFISLMTE